MDGKLMIFLMVSCLTIFEIETKMIVKEEAKLRKRRIALPSLEPSSNSSETDIETDTETSSSISNTSSSSSSDKSSKSKSTDSSSSKSVSRFQVLRCHPENEDGTSQSSNSSGSASPSKKSKGKGKSKSEGKSLSSSSSRRFNKPRNGSVVMQDCDDGEFCALTCSSDMPKCFPCPCANAPDQCVLVYENYEYKVSCNCEGSGFFGPTCEYDINECTVPELNNCDANAECTNTNGSFTCTCKEGFSGSGETCIYFDYCATNPCDVEATCTNTIESYTCTCNWGYTGQGGPGQCECVEC